MKHVGLKTKYISSLCKITISVICTFSASFAIAGERYEFYNGIRSLGMGGATIAVVNDETALIANPAALGKLRDYFVTVADPELDIGGETQAVIGTDIMAFMDPQKSLDKVNDHPRLRLHQRAQIFPSIVVPNFGFGIFAKYEANAFIDAANEYNYEYNNDIAAVFGFNLRLFDGRIKIGVNARGVDHTEIREDDLATSRTDLSIDSLAKEGFGVATDVGIMLAAPWTLLPTLAFVYRDAGRTHYTINKGFMHSPTDTDEPDATPPTLDVAMAIFPILANRTRMTITAEYRDALNTLEPAPTFTEDTDRRLHYGLEFNFSDMFFIRGGMNQNYWTAGFELAIANSQLQVASYGEEVGTAAKPEEDRRYVGKFAWRF